jgi:hypothetical protein
MSLTPSQARAKYMAAAALALRKLEMAKNGGTRSATYARKKAGGNETWTIRSSDGASKTVDTNPGSVLSIDKAAKRYAGAMKRLAKR